MSCDEELMKKQRRLFFCGADLSEIRSYKDIERRYMKAILEQRFGHMDKEAGHIGTNGLEEIRGVKEESHV